MSVDNVNETSGAGGVQSTSGTSAVVSTLYGEVVTELDQQIKDFNKELEATNVEKRETREAKYAFEAAASESSEEPVWIDKDGKAHTGQSDPSKLKTADVAGVIIPTAEYEILRAAAVANGAADSLPATAYYESNIVAMSKEDYDSLMSGVNSKFETKLENLNNMSELKLIKFQSLMDSRKQAMMMLTNTMQSQSQMNQQIVSNLKA